jgi:hypothetical protein
MAFAIQSGLAAEPEPNSTSGIEILVLAANMDPIDNAKLASRTKVLPCRDFMERT